MFVLASVNEFFESLCERIKMSFLAGLIKVERKIKKML